MDGRVVSTERIFIICKFNESMECSTYLEILARACRSYSTLSDRAVASFRSSSIVVASLMSTSSRSSVSYDHDLATLSTPSALAASPRSSPMPENSFTFIVCDRARSPFLLHSYQ